MTSNTHKSFSHISSPSSFFPPAGSKKNFFWPYNISFFPLYYKHMRAWAAEEEFFWQILARICGKRFPPGEKYRYSQICFPYPERQKLLLFSPKKKYAGSLPIPNFWIFAFFFFPRGNARLGSAANIAPWDILRRWQERHFPNIFFFSSREKKWRREMQKLKARFCFFPPSKMLQQFPQLGRISRADPTYSDKFCKKILRRDTTRYFPKKILHNVFSLVMFLFFLSFFLFLLSLPPPMLLSTPLPICRKELFRSPLSWWKEKGKKAHFPI